MGGLGNETKEVIVFSSLHMFPLLLSAKGQFTQWLQLSTEAWGIQALASTQQ